ncbi:MAG: hypothetical protein K6V97_11365 [Actinomycetia bacterium]|nr:hypothetical protein [Actinomycetes bacterium]
MALHGEIPLTPWYDGTRAAFSADVYCQRCGRDGRAGGVFHCGYDGYWMVCVDCLTQVAKEVRLADLAERRTLGEYLRRVRRAMETGDQAQALAALDHLLELRGWDQEATR